MLVQICLHFVSYKILTSLLAIGKMHWVLIFVLQNPFPRALFSRKSSNYLILLNFFTAVIFLFVLLLPDLVYIW